MMNPLTLVWYLILVSGALNLILYAILRDRYLYGIMVIAIRFTQKDKNPVYCKIRVQPPMGPIENVCDRICKDYEKCEKMGGR